MIRDRDLLEELYVIAGCEYLSELKEKNMRDRLFRAMRQINIRDFTFDEWSEAISYLFGTEVSISQYEDIDTYFKTNVGDTKI